jgi:hypothetical protein
MAKTDKELEEYARDCVRLAGMTDDPSIREPLLKMAREWLEAAAAQPPRVTRAAKARSRAKTSTSLGMGAPKCEGPGEVEFTGA